MEYELETCVYTLIDPEPVPPCNGPPVQWVTSLHGDRVGVVGLCEFHKSEEPTDQHKPDGKGRHTLVYRYLTFEEAVCLAVMGT